MKVLAFLFKVVVVLVAIAVVVGLLLPSSSHVERSTTISAPQATVFALVNGFASFNQWSPWYERDPDATYTYQGPDFGVGAKLTWASDNPEVGSGSQTISKSEPFELVESSLDFGPQGTAVAFFRFEPSADGTRVTWGFDTDHGFSIIRRYMGLMFDKWVGPDYEQGLARLKVLAESLPQEDWSDLEIDFVAATPELIAYSAGSSGPDHVEMGQALGAAFGRVQAFMRADGLVATDQPVAITVAMGEEGWSFEAGIPINREPTSTSSTVQVGETPSGRMVKAVHVGPYAEIPATYEKLEAFFAAHNIERGERCWEQYVSDPGETSEEELITHIYWPVK